MTIRSTLFAAAVLAAAAVAAPSQAATNLLVDGGFESPDMSAGQYFYPAGLAGSWNFAGAALVNAEGGSAWWPNGPQPSGFEGQQFVALQGTSSIAQDFTSTGGRIDLSWLNAGRPDHGCCNGDQTYKVLVYNYGAQGITTVGQYSTFSGQQFTQQTASVDLAAGNYALIFQGQINADETAFIDAISAVAVPEPGAWALMILGFGGAGAMLRRRRVAVPI